MKTFADFRIEIPSGASGEVDVTCPECSPNRKNRKARCLSVNTEEGVWVCHHCGWTGGLSEGARKSELHWQPPPRRPKPLPKTDLPPKVVDWFESRGISLQTLADAQVSHTSAYMPQTEQFESCVVFPYYRAGEIINRKYRTGSKDFRMEAGCERILFGLDAMAQTVVITEGEMDALSAQEAGFSAVSVPDGAPTPTAKDYASKFSFLDEDLSAVETWIIAVDDDEPGKRLEDELARRLGRENCSRVIWPEGCKDANEVLVKHGKTALRDLLQSAEPYPIAGAFTARDISDKVLSLYEGGWELGRPTGWPCLNGLYSVRPGEFTVITGIPNSGKSNFMDALAVNLAKNEGWGFAMFSPENQPIEDHAARLMQMWAKQPFHVGPSERLSRETLDEGMRWLDEHFTWVLPDDDSDWTIEKVLDAARALVTRKGIRGLVIDPWNELEHVRPKDMSETEYVGMVLKRVRQFARRNGVHVWMVAHPTKLYRGKDGKYPVPTLYDISGSAHWRAKADNGIVIWRNFKDLSSAIEVHIQKIRFRQIGRLGVAELAYIRETGGYRAVA